jgi:hypothetical protein
MVNFKTLGHDVDLVRMKVTKLKWVLSKSLRHSQFVGSKTWKCHSVMDHLMKLY